MPNLPPEAGGLAAMVVIIPLHLRRIHRSKQEGRLVLRAVTAGFKYCTMVSFPGRPWGKHQSQLLFSAGTIKFLKCGSILRAELQHTPGAESRHCPRGVKSCPNRG